jgi:hypothetical protein
MPEVASLLVGAALGDPLRQVPKLNLSARPRVTQRARAAPGRGGARLPTLDVRPVPAQLILRLALAARLRRPPAAAPALTPPPPGRGPRAARAAARARRGRALMILPSGSRSEAGRREPACLSSTCAHRTVCPAKRLARSSPSPPSALRLRAGTPFTRKRAPPSGAPKRSSLPSFSAVGTCSLMRCPSIHVPCADLRSCTYTIPCSPARSRALPGVTPPPLRCHGRRGGHSPW